MTAAGARRRVLVTGGAGFIGSHLVERLVRRDDHVVVIDNLSTGRRRNLDAVRDRVDVVEASVTAGLDRYSPGDFDEIYHLAAAVGVRLVIEQPIRTIETNVHETSAILEFASPCRTPTLLASTSEVYGKTTKMPFHEDDDVVYGATTLHRWSYACSKAIDEYLALAHHRERDLPVAIVRFFNTVGPRQIGEYGMVLPRFVDAARAGQPLLVHGDGAQTRCFCDVRDVVDALPRLLASPRGVGRVFNLGSDEPISILGLAELVRGTLGSSSPIELVPYEEAFGAGFDDLRHRQPDIGRIRDAIGFEPRITLEQTIRDLAAHLASPTRERHP
ncbi:MAG: GDP-mannose 4,6-dehydratase [Phycisphaerales bacterium]|nr:GDP-mannose 4,6-dehydratase [Phycisphaerales bacterium]